MCSRLVLIKSHAFSLDLQQWMCDVAVKEALFENCKPVVVDNTNIFVAHMKPYINLVRSFISAGSARGAFRRVEMAIDGAFTQAGLAIVRVERPK